MPSAAEVLAAHQWEFDNRYFCTCRADIPDPHSDFEMAKHQLAALKDAGFAVIELPKQTIIPTGWREDCVGCWPSGIGERAFEDPVSAWPGNEGISLPNGDFMSADRARVFAAGLLAAADAAEATE